MSEPEPFSAFLPIHKASTWQQLRASVRQSRTQALFIPGTQGQGRLRRSSMPALLVLVIATCGWDWVWASAAEKGSLPSPVQFPIGDAGSTLGVALLAILEPCSCPAYGMWVPGRRHQLKRPGAAATLSLTLTQHLNQPVSSTRTLVDFTWSEEQAIKQSSKPFPKRTDFICNRVWISLNWRVLS